MQSTTKSEDQIRKEQDFKENYLGREISNYERKVENLDFSSFITFIGFILLLPGLISVFLFFYDLFTPNSGVMKNLSDIWFENNDTIIKYITFMTFAGAYLIKKNIKIKL